MRRLRLTAAALVGCATLALAPASALALSPVTQDCHANGELIGHYTISQLQLALKTMPTTIAEYSNCPLIIQDQISKQQDKHVKLKGADVGAGLSSTLFAVIVVVVVLICAGGGFLYSRRRSGGEGPAGPPPIAG